MSFAHESEFQTPRFVFVEQALVANDIHHMATAQRDHFRGRRKGRSFKGFSNVPLA